MRWLAVLAVVGLLAAGCGGAPSSDPARFMPRDTVRFFTADTDSGWKPVARAVLGDDRVALPPRTQAFAVAVRRNGSKVAVYRVDGRWQGSARDRSLADDPRYRAALDATPAGALARGFLRGNTVKPLVTSFPGQTTFLVGSTRSRFRVRQPPKPVVSIAFLQYRWGAAWLTDDGAGFRAKTDGLPLAESFRVRSLETVVNPYEPALFDEIPADVLAVADFPLPAGTFRLLERLPAQLTALFPQNDFILPSQLDAVLSGETAIYWRKGGEVTVVSSPPDLAAAEEALDELARQLPFAVHHASLGGQLVISTTPRGIAAFRGPGPKLSSLDLGLPEEVSAAFYAGPGAPKTVAERPLTAWFGRDGADPTFTVRFGS